jgi:hypothetical protein
VSTETKLGQERVCGFKGSMGRIVALVFIVILGIVLRILGAHGDLWLDEIWALESLDKPFSLPLLNGHLSLYTLWGGLLSHFPKPLLYRLPALVVSGAFLFYVFHLVCSKRLSFATLCFVSLGYPLVLYGSEGRGYAFLPIAACVVLIALGPKCDTSSKHSSLKASATLWVATLGALFFHSSFFIFFSACSLVFLVRSATAGDLGGWYKRCLTLHFVSAALVALFFIISRSGGGPPVSLLELFISSVSISWGGPVVTKSTELLSLFVAFGVLSASLASYREMKARREVFAMWCLEVAAATFILVFLVFIVTGQHAAMRYVLCGVVAWYLGIGQTIGVIIKEASQSSRVGLAFVIFSFLGGSLYHATLLAQYGRGTYSQALTYIHDTEREVSVASDHLFRNSSLIDFYSEQLGLTVALVESPARAQFYLSHDFFPYPHRPELRELVLDGTLFTYEKSFPAAPLSGWTWHLYRKDTKVD